MAAGFEAAVKAREEELLPVYRQVSHAVLRNIPFLGLPCKMHSIAQPCLASAEFKGPTDNLKELERTYEGPV